MSKPEKRISGTKEWSAFSANIQTGCDRDCLMCYAKSGAIRFGRCTADTWKNPVLSKNATKAVWPKYPGTVMFPTTHDMSDDNIIPYMDTLRALLSAGNNVLLVTKPKLSLVARICEMLTTNPCAAYTDAKNRLLWRITIGCPNTTYLSMWEPGASSFEERLQSLAYVWAHGFQTSVSAEPLLCRDTNEVAKLLAFVRPFTTHSVWLGRANMLKARVKINTKGNSVAMMMADALAQVWTDDRVRRLYERFKDDPIVRWKDSIKKVVGLPSNEAAGEDK